MTPDIWLSGAGRTTAVTTNQLVQSSSENDILSVKGDENRDPCQPFSNHGFFGVEATVVSKIKDWLK